MAENGDADGSVVAPRWHTEDAVTDAIQHRSDQSAGAELAPRVRSVAEGGGLDGGEQQRDAETPPAVRPHPAAVGVVQPAVPDARDGPDCEPSRRARGAFVVGEPPSELLGERERGDRTRELQESISSS